MTDFGWRAWLDVAWTGLIGGAQLALFPSGTRPQVRVRAPPVRAPQHGPPDGAARSGDAIPQLGLVRRRGALVTGAAAGGRHPAVSEPFQSALPLLCVRPAPATAPPLHGLRGRVWQH